MKGDVLEPAMWIFVAGSFVNAIYFLIHGNNISAMFSVGGTIAAFFLGMDYDLQPGDRFPKKRVLK